VLRSVHEYAVAKKERSVIEVWIRVSDRAGKWQLQALEVSDGQGRSYNVYGWPEVYASHEEAVILAKARARERIAEVWSSVRPEQIRWRIYTGPDRQGL
jgi:hypothetical protein